MKRFLLAVGVSIAVLGSGVAAAGMLSTSPSRSPSPDEKQAHPPAHHDTPDTGIHGGPMVRVHTQSACNLVDASTLSGNWTHGDYVSAVTALGDSSLVPIAAHSDCGKRQVAEGHRHGPPDSANQMGKANGGG